jgi:proteasome lid subunit RPN8/RPN11
MMPAQSRIDAGIWSVPGHSIVIEYSRPVLKGILKHTVEGFDAYLAGGYEVGGVLFGEHSDNVVRILGFRPLRLEPPRPSFVLSESDGARLTDLIQRARRDPELASYEVVGWYHSHTRSEIFLSTADTEIYDRYFPEPWQIAMVLRPTAERPVSIGFFFREDDGFVRTDQSYLEFAADSPAERPEQRPEPPWVAGPAGEVEEFVPVEPEPEPAPVPMPVVAADTASASRRGAIFIWSLFLLAVLALGAAGYDFILSNQPNDPLGLQLAPSGNELVVRWNPANPVFREAGDATLLITDGSKRMAIPLLGRKTPFHTYRPVTDRVDVRLQLKLSWGRTRMDAATYLRHPDIGKPSPELARAMVNLEKAEKQAAEIRGEVSDKAAENARLQNRIDELRHILKQMAEARKPKKLVLPPSRDRRLPAPKELPSAPEIAVRGSVHLPPQASLELRPPVEPPKTLPPPPPAAAVRTTPTVTPAPIPKPIPPPVAAVAAPSSGRILWMGDLPKGGALQIEGRQASRGYVNGELPVAARVGAYPAELTNDGLKVYTGNPRYAQSPRTEAPSASNGWQKTQFVYDPKALRDLIVEQMPGPQDPRKLVLRAGRRLSIIVIEWQVVSP